MRNSRVLLADCVLSLVLATMVAFPAIAVEDEQLWVESAAARGVLVAANPSHGFAARLGPEGLQVLPGGGDWELGLALSRSGRQGALTAVAPVVPFADGARAELRRGDLVEYFVNGEAGIEHGFEVGERPGGEGPLVLELALSGDLLALPEPGERSVALIRPGSPLAVLHYGGLEVVDAHGQSVAARLGPAAGGAGGLRIVVEDEDALYPLTVDPLLTAAAWTSADSDSTQSIAWGDWDGDGDLDLAAGNLGQPNRVYENTGGALTSAWTSADSDRTYSIAWGDWDGDGDLDLAAGNQGQNRVYENTGGALTSAWTSADSDRTYSIAWGDWDADGDLDVAAGNYGQANRVYENTGGALTSAWTSADSDYSRSIAWGDWDGDGDLDLAAGNYGQANRVYENTGGALTSAWTSADSDYSRSIAWGDWDGDGDLDLAAGNDGHNRVYENTGGALTSAWTSADSDSTLSVAWGDWDGDGDLDLAAGNYGQANRVYENTGGALSSAWTSADSDSTLSIAWGDWDGDGDLDLAAGNHGQHRVYENTGGALTSAWTSADSDRTYSIAWGDWDGDGDLDLAAGNYGQANRVYENSGGALTSAWTSADGDLTLSVAWGDWDGDGDLDLAAGNYGQANRVYENSGGALTSAWTSADSSNTRSVAWGDWDGDGDLDLAAGNYGQNQVYENSGGALTSAWTSADGDLTLSVAWGDWDGDGDLDLAAGNDGQPNRVYENSGGALTSAWTSADGDDTRSVAWGDWDGDGDLDLAAGNDGQNQVYENTGGALTSAWTSADSASTRSVAWGDWDGDGDLDLAAGNYGQANRVYENTGGALTSAWTSADGDLTLSVAWGDWDGDGDLDLAAGNYGQANRVYENGNLRRPGGLPESPVSPVIMERPGSTDAAFFHSAQECLASPIVLQYELLDEEWDPARRVVAEYSLAGGGAWWPATLAWSDGTEDVAALPTGAQHVLVWDAPADGVTRADDVVLRITVPYQASTRLAGPIQRAAMSATSPPFRVCDPAADLSVTKTDGQDQARPGETIAYTIRVANDGPNDVVGAVVSDTFPMVFTGVSWSCDEGGGGTCGSASGSGDIHETVDLPVGTWVTLTATGTVDPAASGLLSNTASVAIPEGMTEIDETNNTAMDTDILTPSSDLAITKTDGVDVAVPGETVIYAIVVSNVGPSDASGAQVVDTFPTAISSVSWSCDESGGGTCSEGSGSSHIATTVDLPVGTSVAFTATAGIDPAATVSLVNVASVSAPAARNGERGDPSPGNNTATDVDTLTPEVDLEITKDDGSTQVELDDVVTYTITVTNPGPSAVTGATVTDTFPSSLAGVTWTCDETGGGSCANPSGTGDIGETVDLPAGTSVIFTAQGTVGSGAALGISNTATVTCPSGVTERDPSDNSATDTNLGWVIFIDGFEDGTMDAWL